MGFWNSVKRALGLKQYTIGSVSTFVGGLYAPMQAWLDGIGVTFLPEMHFVVSALIVFLFCLVLFFALRLRDLETRLYPCLDLSVPVISKARMGPPTRGDESTQYVRANYVHIVVHNKSEVPITNCAVHLTGLKKINSDGEYVLAEVSNPIQLVTASTHLKADTIYPELAKHFDIVYTISDGNSLDISPPINAPHAIPASFFREIGKYDFSIVVTGDNTPTRKANLRITWDGQWDEVKAEILKVTTS